MKTGQRGSLLLPPPPAEPRLTAACRATSGSRTLQLQLQQQNELMERVRGPTFNGRPPRATHWGGAEPVRGRSEDIVELVVKTRRCVFFQLSLNVWPHNGISCFISFLSIQFFLFTYFLLSLFLFGIVVFMLLIFLVFHFFFCLFSICFFHQYFPDCKPWHFRQYLVSVTCETTSWCRIGANFHVIPVRVVKFGPSCANAHIGGWFVSCSAANNHPYFHQRESKVPYKCAAPPPRLQSMALSTRSRWCGADLAGADLVRILRKWCGFGAVRCGFGAVRCGNGASRPAVRISATRNRTATWTINVMCRLPWRAIKNRYHDVLFVCLCP